MTISPSQLNDNFLNLTDSPNTFVGNSGKGIVVNSGATALEFSSVASYSSSPADIPPIIPSIYDDEFNGVSLDPKWGWYYYGAPTSVSVANGKLLLNFAVDRSGMENASILAQSAPDQSFSIVAKMHAFQHMYSWQGLFMGNSSFGNDSMICIGYGWNIPTVYVTIRVGNGWLTINSDYPYLSCKDVYLKATWNKSTAKFRGWVSPDGLIWLPVTNGTTDDNNLTTINYFGLGFLPNFWPDANMAVSVDYFRVTL